MVVIGERSSCDASDTKRRWLFRALSSRSSMRFMVAASRPISSSALGCGTRRCSCAAEISSTSRRIASTGASARPTANHVVSATTATSNGSPMISSRVTTVVVSRTSTNALATRTIRRPSDVCAPSATATNSSSSSGVTTCADWPGAKRTTAGLPAMFGLDATTAPAGVIT